MDVDKVHNGIAFVGVGDGVASEHIHCSICRCESHEAILVIDGEKQTIGRR